MRSVGGLIRRIFQAIGYYPVNMRHDLGSGFLLPIHLRNLLESLEINCVFDVGANIGQYGKLLRSIGYQGRILSFEPVQAAYQGLQREASGDPLWQTFDYALGAEPGRHIINASSLSYISSFFAPNEQLNNMLPSSFRPEEVRIETLDAVFETVMKDVVSPRLFLKTDTQGFDLEVIKGAQRSLGKFLGLQAELSVRNFYRNAPSYLDALKFYTDLGFSLKNVYTGVLDQTDGTVMEFDCLMIRH